MTDLRSGEAVVMERGEVGVAVQASSSAPGLLEPVKLGGRLLGDGNLAAPVPVDLARGLGEHIEAGELAALEVLPALRKLFERR